MYITINLTFFALCCFHPHMSVITHRKPTVVKAKKPSASSLASLTRPKQGYVYEGNGKSGDREFST